MKDLIFFYNLDKLYYHDPVNRAFGHRKVESMTLKCYNVTPAGKNFTGNNAWDFQLVGGDDTWFRTQYDWALVLDTPDNMAHYHRWQNLSRERDEVAKVASAAHDRIVNPKVLAQKARDDNS